MGLLAYLSRFHLDIYRAAAPIRRLLGRNNPGVWDEACTRALNQVAEVVDRRLPLKIPVPGEPFHLFVTFHSGMLSGVLCQLVKDHH